MSSLKHAASIGSLSAVAMLAAACQTQPNGVLTGGNPGGPAGQPSPKIEIQQPVSLEQLASGAPFTIQWTYFNLGAPQWKLFLNTGSTGFVEQSTTPQCGQGTCNASMTLYPGVYELIIKEMTTGTDDKVAFTVQ